MLHEQASWFASSWFSFNFFFLIIHLIFLIFFRFLFFLFLIILYIVFCSSNFKHTSSFLTFPIQEFFKILLQHHISKALIIFFLLWVSSKFLPHTVLHALQNLYEIFSGFKTYIFCHERISLFVEGLFYAILLFMFVSLFSSYVIFLPKYVDDCTVSYFLISIVTFDFGTC